MTPYELELSIYGYIEQEKRRAEEYHIKLENERDLAITQAWLTANWTRAKKMPELNSVLSRSKPKKQMSSTEIYEQLIKFANINREGATENA